MPQMTVLRSVNPRTSPLTGPTGTPQDWFCLNRQPADPYRSRHQGHHRYRRRARPRRKRQRRRLSDLATTRRQGQVLHHSQGALGAAARTPQQAAAVSMHERRPPLSGRRTTSPNDTPCLNRGRTLKQATQTSHTHPTPRTDTHTHAHTTPLPTHHTTQLVATCPCGMPSLTRAMPHTQANAASSIGTAVPGSSRPSRRRSRILQSRINDIGCLRRAHR